MTKPLTTEIFVAKAKRLHGDKYDYSKTVYTRSNKKVIVICPIHGEFLTGANNHISLRNLCGCPRCGGTGRLGQALFLERSKSIHGDKWNYDKVKYVTNSTNVIIGCPIHGDFEQKPAKHLIGRGCPYCGGTRLKDASALLDRAAVEHKGKYDYSLVPNNAKSKDYVDILCPKHGPFSLTMSMHVHRLYGCPRCGQKSSIEDELAEYIEGLGVSIQRRNRKIIAPKEIDIYIPSHKLALEMHGVYHHTYDRVSDLHLHKWKETQKLGIQLVQIFSDEWGARKEQIKNRIRALLGLNDKYDARKLNLELNRRDECIQFLNDNHLQGSGRAEEYYALVDKDRILAVASFAHSRTGSMTRSNNKDEWEVVRYASLGRVRGGFSKLFKHFLKNHNPEKVISYCDLRYGNGKVYEKSGFALDSISEPDYWWVPKDKNVRVARYRTQKHKLSQFKDLAHTYSPDKSEKQICEDAGWRKIFGVGNQKWVYYTVDRTNKIE